MRSISLSFLLLAAMGGCCAAAESPLEIWRDAAAKRASLASFHQEFERSSLRTGGPHPQSWKYNMQLDGAGGSWRKSGSADSDVTMFNGEQYFSMQQGGEEYVVLKYKPKDGASIPEPYDLEKADWANAKLVSEMGCDLKVVDHKCAVVQIPLLPRASLTSNGSSHMLGGTASFMIDRNNGLVLAARFVEDYQFVGGGAAGTSYRSELTFQQTRMSFGRPPDMSLFTPPDNARKVGHLKAWDAAMVKKQLAGKPAPALSAMDIQGRPVNLADLKGKTVLLDFFTTWCGPCRSDGPFLDKLYSQYGGKDLVIVGISVGEDRPIVEKFLQEYRHEYPIVLSAENNLSRAYQIEEFPTYMAIDAEGKMATAVADSQGYSGLMALLKKAGFEK